MARKRPRIGMFRRRATVYKIPDSPTVDAGNNPSYTPDEVFCVRYCRIVASYGTEFEVGQTQSHELGTVTIEMRSDEESRAITPDMEIVVDQIRYEIVAAPDRNNPERQIVRLRCTELN